MKKVPCVLCHATLEATTMCSFQSDASKMRRKYGNGFCMRVILMLMCIVLRFRCKYSAYDIFDVFPPCVLDSEVRTAAVANVVTPNVAY